MGPVPSRGTGPNKPVARRRGTKYVWPMPRIRALAPTGFALATLLLVAGPARADEVTYEIHKTTSPATVGVASNVSMTVVGKNGWHMNGEAPITASVKADPGVTLPKAKLTRADLAASTKQSARFDIPFSASEPGKKTITAQARFVMCQEEACKPASETVAFEVDVQATGAKTTDEKADKAGPPATKGRHAAKKRASATP